MYYVRWNGGGVFGSTAILSRVVRKGLRKKVIFEWRSEEVVAESHMETRKEDSREKRANPRVLMLEAAWGAPGRARLSALMEHSQQRESSRRYRQRGHGVSWHNEGLRIGVSDVLRPLATQPVSAEGSQHSFCVSSGCVPSVSRGKCVSLLFPVSGGCPRFLAVALFFQLQS